MWRTIAKTIHGPTIGIRQMSHHSRRPSNNSPPPPAIRMVIGCTEASLPHARNAIAGNTKNRRN